MSKVPVIHIQNFEGPLDLLLHLIRSSSIDIYDIPIVAITDQYMLALRDMQDHQLDVAGDYFVMAATLMKMKAKLLLPSQEEPEDEPEEESLEDMQAKLVSQLVEYQRFKTAANWFKGQEVSRQQYYTRPEMAIPAGVRLGQLPPGILSIELQMALTGLTQRKRQAEKPLQLINEERYTVKTQIKKIRGRLMQTRATVTFGQLFGQKPNREEVVTTFLALLEMTKQHEVTLDQPDRVMPIKVKMRNADEEK